MKKGIKRLAIVLYAGIGPLLPSCSDEVSPEAYVRKVAEAEDLQKLVKVGQIVYHFKMVTPEWMALKAAYNPDTHTLDKETYSRRLSDMTGSLFLIMEQVVEGSKSSVLKYKVSGRPEYEQRVLYYQFYAKEDFQMSCGGKTIRPTGYTYENQMEVSPVNKAVVVFPNDSTCHEFTISFDDRALANRFIKASFNRKDLEALPRLSIK